MLQQKPFDFTTNSPLRVFVVLLDQCFAPFHSPSPLADPDSVPTFRTLPLCNSHGVGSYHLTPRRIVFVVVVVNDYEYR